MADSSGSGVRVGLNRRRDEGVRLVIRPGVGPASLRRHAPARPRLGEPGRRWALSRSPGEAEDCVWCAPSLIASFGRTVPPPGLQSRYLPRWSPEAPALPGGGPVRGHTPQSSEESPLLCPRDRSGGPVSPDAAWPPRAAKGQPATEGRPPAVGSAGSAGANTANPGGLSAR